MALGVAYDLRVGPGNVVRGWAVAREGHERIPFTQILVHKLIRGHELPGKGHPKVASIHSLCLLKTE